MGNLNEYKVAQYILLTTKYTSICIQKWSTKWHAIVFFGKPRAYQEHRRGVTSTERPYKKASLKENISNIGYFSHFIKKIDKLSRFQYLFVQKIKVCLFQMLNVERFPVHLVVIRSSTNLSNWRYAGLRPAHIIIEAEISKRTKIQNIKINWQSRLHLSCMWNILD